MMRPCLSPANRAVFESDATESFGQLLCLRDTEPSADPLAADASRLQAAHVGSSVMMPTGPLSFALAKSEPLPFVGVGDSPPESLPTTNTVITTVTAITASTAIPAKIHLPLPPRRGGGPGGGPHGCCGPHCGAPPGWPPGGGPHGCAPRADRPSAVASPTDSEAGAHSSAHLRVTNAHVTARFPVRTSPGASAPACAAAAEHPATASAAARSPVPVPHCSVPRHRRKESAALLLRLLARRIRRASPRPVTRRSLIRLRIGLFPCAACHLADLLHRALHALHDSLRNRRRHARQLHWYLGGLLCHLHRHAHHLAHLTRLLRGARRRSRARCRSSSPGCRPRRRSPGTGTLRRPQVRTTP